jgi:O-methyltransferase involved in polyketide biosynthesis
MQTLKVLKQDNMQNHLIILHGLLYYLTLEMIQTVFNVTIIVQH